MTIQLPALGARAGVIGTAVALVAVGMVVASPARAADTSSTQVLAEGIGMHAKPSVRVRQVQRALKRRGYSLGAPGVDGRFGPRTAAAVRRLQRAHGLVVDGIVGKHTRAALGLGRRSASKQQAAQPQQTSKPQSTTPQTTTNQPAPAAAATSTPSTVTVLSPSSGQSSNTAERVLFWGALGVLLAFGLGWLLRRYGGEGEPESAAVPNPVERAALPAPWTPAPQTTVARGEPMIGYLATPSGTWSEEHERSAEAIEAACERSAWELLDIVWDRENGRPLERPGLTYACERIANGQARGLIVSDLQRLSRSADEMGAFMAFFRDADATLVGLDIDLDTSTPGGRFFADRLIKQTEGREADRRAAVGMGRANGRGT
jgi:hypothetical protein